MPDEIAIDSGGSSMVRDMKTVPTDMPLLRSIQVLERYFMLQCIVYMYIHVLYLVSLEQAVRAWPTNVTPSFRYTSWACPHGSTLVGLGVLRAMLKFVLWLRILMCPDIYHNHVFVIDKDTAH